MRVGSMGLGLERVLRWAQKWAVELRVFMASTNFLIYPFKSRQAIVCKNGNDYDSSFVRSRPTLTYSWLLSAEIYLSAVSDGFGGVVGEGGLAGVDVNTELLIVVQKGWRVGRPPSCSMRE